jgi:SAM-dependent methyltransferase
MIKALERILNRARWRFKWRYWRGDTPWDTQITPPEVEAFISQHPPGRALDLGCGTGTNAITLARHGWRVTGVDFVPSAIRAACAKADGSGLAVEFFVADVTRLETLNGPYDYVLDIGCLFSLAPEEKLNYRSQLRRLLRPGGCYMLYAWLPRLWQGRTIGIAVEDVHRLLKADLVRERVLVGEERGHGSAWYWYRRK